MKYYSAKGEIKKSFKVENVSKDFLNGHINKMQITNNLVRPKR